MRGAAIGRGQGGQRTGGRGQSVIHANRPTADDLAKMVQKSISENPNFNASQASQQSQPTQQPFVSMNGAGNGQSQPQDMGSTFQQQPSQPNYGSQPQQAPNQTPNEFVSQQPQQQQQWNAGAMAQQTGFERQQQPTLSGFNNTSQPQQQTGFERQQQPTQQQAPSLSSFNQQPPSQPNGFAQPPSQPNGFAQPPSQPNGFAQPQSQPNGFARPQQQQQTSTDFNAAPNQARNGFAQQQSAPNQAPNGFAQQQSAPNQAPNGFAQQQPAPNSASNEFANQQQTSTKFDSTPAQAPNNGFAPLQPQQPVPSQTPNGFANQQSGFNNPSQPSQQPEAPQQEQQPTQDDQQPAQDGPPKFGRGSGANRTPMGAGENQSQQGFGNNRQRSDKNADNTEGGGEHRGSAYVPPTRDMDAIFKEDADQATLYSAVVDNDEEVTVTGAAPVRMERWHEGNLHPTVLANIERAGYQRPRHIQSYSIPYIMEGRDLKAQAETGSGKSAAFLVPIISLIAHSKNDTTTEGLNNKPKCLVIEPTRELALQLYEQARKFANGSGVQTVKCYGEYNFKRNAEEVLQGCDVIVGTPGRMLHFMNDGIINCDHIKYLVLDEADRLLDQQFKEVIKKMQQLQSFPKKENLQTMLFSATFPKDVEQWSAEMLKNDRVSVKNAREDAPNARVVQKFAACPRHEKKDKVVKTLQEELEKAQQKDPNAGQPRTLIFVTTRRDADVLALYLCESKFRACTINGDRTQKLREEALDQFRNNVSPILVATDVCARGLDIKDMDFVVNMDLPKDLTTYIHRIGRTGRLRAGQALSFVDASDTADCNLAPQLVEQLKKDGHDVPEFLIKVGQPVDVHDIDYSLGF